MGHSGLELRIPPQVCRKTCKDRSDLSLPSSVMSPHPAQASGPGCGLSLSLAGGPASGWSGGGTSSPSSRRPPARIWGLSRTKFVTLLPLWDGNCAFGMALGFCLAQSGSADAQGAACPLGGAWALSLAGPELQVSLQPPVPSPGKAAPSCPLSSGSPSPQCPALLPALHGGVVGWMRVSELIFQHERK